MESESRFQQIWSQFVEKLNEQVWFQQIKSKWDELDPQSRTYLGLGGVGALVLGTLLLLGIWSWNVNGTMREVAEKSDLLGQLQSANDEVRRLKEAAGGGMQAGEGGWSAFIGAQAAQVGIDPAALTVGEEKAGATTDLAKESLIEVSAKKVNLRQLVRLAFGLESAGRPVKLRALTVDTRGEDTGWLDATLQLSAFAPKSAP
jgi:hypothetical protein